MNINGRLVPGQKNDPIISVMVRNLPHKGTYSIKKELFSCRCFLHELLIHEIRRNWKVSLGTWEYWALLETSCKSVFTCVCRCARTHTHTISHHHVFVYVFCFYMEYLFYFLFISKTPIACALLGGKASSILLTRLFLPSLFVELCVFTTISHVLVCFLIISFHPVYSQLSVYL